MKSTNQPNLFQHSDAARAAAYRTAAETVRFDPHFTHAERERRAAEYETEAQRIEAAANLPAAKASSRLAA